MAHEHWWEQKNPDGTPSPILGPTPPSPGIDDAYAQEDSSAPDYESTPDRPAQLPEAHAPPAARPAALPLTARPPTPPGGGETHARKRPLHEHLHGACPAPSQPRPATAPPARDRVQPLHLLYCGVESASSLRTEMDVFGASRGYDVVFTHADLTDESVFADISNRCARGEFHIGVCSMDCPSTAYGPGDAITTLRDRDHPLGVPNLQPHLRARVHAANAKVRLMVIVSSMVYASGGEIILFASASVATAAISVLDGDAFGAEHARRADLWRNPWLHTLRGAFGTLGGMANWRDPASGRVTRVVVDCERFQARPPPCHSAHAPWRIRIRPAPPEPAACDTGGLLAVHAPLGGACVRSPSTRRFAIGSSGETCRLSSHSYAAAGS